MEFRFSSEQDQLRDAARAFLAGRCSREHVRRLLATAATVDTGLWRQMADLGWLSLPLASEPGGFVETCIILEEIGRALAPVPYLPTVLAMGALERAGRHTLARRLSSGDQIGSATWERQLAVSGPDASVVVRGSQSSVTLASAEAMVAEPAMDATRSVGWPAGDQEEIGDADDAADLLNRGAVGTSALLLGGASRVLEMSSQYARTRQQFGRAIGSFQAIKHHCANMLVDVEAMRSLIYWAAWCLDEGHHDAAVAASTAKAWCADAGVRVIDTGLQVHGGIGFTWEHDLHLYIKRANVDRVSFGSSRFHRTRLAGLLRTRSHAIDQLF